MRDTVEEVGMNLLVKYSGGLLHMDGRAKAERLARTYIKQLYADTGCSPEDLPEAIDDREGWREKVRDIRADGAT